MILIIASHSRSKRRLLFLVSVAQLRTKRHDGDRYLPVGWGVVSWSLYLLYSSG